ncbi:hypothetical protein RN001_009875 [Aquatica leii]|uniref:Uncharacterized protein n=1 Tax=Aquatica leii TaxID=1421715 RepID=A0AAN7PU72_9COLE|nr:hypothetical protein RN001_009875 [Aquatica leii]
MAENKILSDEELKLALKDSDDKNYVLGITEATLKTNDKPEFNVSKNNTGKEKASHYDTSVCRHRCKTVYGLKNNNDSDVILTPNEEVDAASEDFVDGISISSENLELVCDDNVEETPTVSTGTVEENPTVSTDNGGARDWGHYKGSDLGKPMTSSLKRMRPKASKVKLNLSKRRPMSLVRTFTSSSLGEEYKRLLEKKMELVECHKKEHELRYELLQLEVKIKKQELANLLKL